VEVADILEECVASIFRAQEQGRKQQATCTLVLYKCVEIKVENKCPSADIQYAQNK
jgi:hypothetical protein